MVLSEAQWLERVRAWDAHLVEAVKPIRVLGPLSWPASAEHAYLEALARGAPRLPSPPRTRLDQARPRAALGALLEHIDEGHPLAAFLGRTARSYLRVLDLLDARGQPHFVAHSTALFGHPRDPVAPGQPAGPRHLDAAQAFLAASEGCELPDEAETLDSEAAADWLRGRLEGLFAEPLPVELDPELPALASAGSRRVRLRDGARFSELHLRQLLEHEALVHTATKRSGKAQPVLRSLGLSSPRTTAAQEGLATLAELVTDTMDMRRLRRVALRIVAVDAALEGADFHEVFDIFREGGQVAQEAFRSAARVFRGGDPRGGEGGGVAFTKDVVYLRGMARVHTFLLAAIRDGHTDLPARLFAGRMTLGDALVLEPWFEDGTLSPAQVLPAWVRSLSTLTAYLTWAGFSARIPVSEVRLDDFLGDAA